MRYPFVKIFGVFWVTPKDPKTQKLQVFIAIFVVFEHLRLITVTALSRTGLSLQTAGDRKRPWMQPAIPQMVFQLLTQKL